MPYTFPDLKTSGKGYRMSEQDQSAIAFAARKEYEDIRKTCDGLKEAILHHADEHAELAKRLRTEMDRMIPDKATAVAEAEKLCDLLAQYQTSLGEKAYKYARLEPFKHFFTPLE